MALFNGNREKTDLEKNEPKKTGIMLGLTTIRRELISLITLNFIFDIFLLPLVGIFLAWTLGGWPAGPIIAIVCALIFLFTMPAALTAMSRITVTMVRDENFFLWPDFWRAWAKNYGRSLLGGFVFFPGMGLLVLAGAVYYRIFGGHSFLLVIILAFAACMAIILLTACFYFWPMLSYVDLPFRALFKNSLLLVMGCWKRSLLALLTVLIVFVIVGFWPPTGYDFLLMLVLMFGFSLFSLCMSFAVYPAIDEKVIRKAETKEQEERIQVHEDLEWEEEELHSASIRDLDFGPDEEGK